MNVVAVGKRQATPYPVAIGNGVCCQAYEGYPAMVSVPSVSAGMLAATAPPYTS
jgi:hypothetical protein